MMFSHFIYPGYEAFIGDHKVYMPSILKKLDSSLYPNDPLMPFLHGAYTLFDEFVVFLVESFGLDLFVVLFCISIVLRFIFYYTIYLLGMYLSKDRIFSLLLVIFFCLVQVKFGSFINHILPRSFGIVLALLSLTLYFGQRRIASAFALSACLLFHPIFFLQFGAFFYLALIIDCIKKNIKPRYLLLGLIPATLLLALLSIYNTSELSIFKQMSRQYYMFLKERTPDVFLLSSQGLKVIGTYLFNYLVFGFAFYKLKDRIEPLHRRYLMLIVVVTLVFLFVTILGVDVAKSVFIFNIQTMRAYQLLKLIAATLFVLSTYNQLKSHPHDHVTNFMFISTAISLVAVTNLSLLFLALLCGTLIFKRYSNILSKILSLRIFLSLIALFLTCFLLFLYSSGNVYSVVKVIFTFTFSLMFFYLIKFLGFYTFSKIALMVIFVSAVGTTLFQTGNFTIYPKIYKDRNFMEVANWIKDNTAKEAVFITEPFTSKGEEIRVISGRSIFATFKNAAPGVFSEKIAMEWMQRYSFVKQFMKKINKYDPLRSPSFFYVGSKPIIPFMRTWCQKKEIKSNDGIKKFLATSPEVELFIRKVMRRYKMHYVLSEVPLLLGFPVSFKNDEYFIYKLN